MKSRRDPRRGRPAPLEIPPWWSNGAPPRAAASTEVAERPGYHHPDGTEGRYYDDGARSLPAMDEDPPDEYQTDQWPVEGEYPPEDDSGREESPGVEGDHGYAEASPGDWAAPPPELPQQKMPSGRWINGHSHGDRLWVPDRRPPERDSPPAAVDSSPTSADLPAPPAGPTAPPVASGSELAAMRPADEGSGRVRTTVDRPVAALRKVGLDEARQLAESFAVEYMSCDEDHPEWRGEALAPYLSRRSDAMLGWPGERAGVGRHRAVLPIAGEHIEQGPWITIDVRVLIEIYERRGDAPEAPPAQRRPDPPPGARWSAVPPAEAPGWAVSMTVWQRLGVPVRRHDFGHLVVELFTVSDPESDRGGATP